MDSRHEKENFEALASHFFNIYMGCRDKTMKTSNFSQAGTDRPSDEELRNFKNCITK